MEFVESSTLMKTHAAAAILATLLTTTACVQNSNPPRAARSNLATVGEELPIVAAPPGVAIDFYPVYETRKTGGRYVNTRTLPTLGYIEGAPALQVERLKSVRKFHTKSSTSISSADGRERLATSTVPAIEMTLRRDDARAFSELMKNSIGQRIYIEAQGTGIYAPLVREALPATVLTFSLADDAQQEDVYRKLAPFVKK